MKIETERLVIFPLSCPQLKKYMLNDGSLEAELKLNPTSRSISPELSEALQQTILPAVTDKNKNYLFSTLWTMVLKAENKMIGDLCFMGEPDEAGAIEIGYGTYNEFQGKGYMSEAVGAMIKWAATQPAVKSIIASTNRSNMSSYKVLVNNNFVKIGETETMFTFKLEVQ